MPSTASQLEEKTPGRNNLATTTRGNWLGGWGEPGGEQREASFGSLAALNWQVARERIQQLLHRPSWRTTVLHAGYA